MKSIIFSVLTIVHFVSISQTKTAEKKDRKNQTIYGEIFGQGFGGSLNYDILFNTSKKVINSHTFGVTYIPRSFQFGDGEYKGGHYAYNFLIGKKNHHLELGLGISGLITDNFGNTKSLYTYFTPKLGYRYQSAKGGFFLKASLTPMIAFLNIEQNGLLTPTNPNITLFRNVNNIGYSVFPWPGLSLGYTF